MILKVVSHQNIKAFCASPRIEKLKKFVYRKNVNKKMTKTIIVCSTWSNNTGLLTEVMI